MRMFIQKGINKYPSIFVHELKKIMSSNSTATVKYHQNAEIPFVHLTKTDIQHPGLSGISVTCHLSDHLLYCTSAIFSFGLPLTFSLPNQDFPVLNLLSYAWCLFTLQLLLYSFLTLITDSLFILSLYQILSSSLLPYPGGPSH